MLFRSIWSALTNPAPSPPPPPLLILIRFTLHSLQLPSFPSPDPELFILSKTTVEKETTETPKLLLSTNHDDKDERREGNGNKWGANRQERELTADPEASVNETNQKPKERRIVSSSYLFILFSLSLSLSSIGIGISQTSLWTWTFTTLWFKPGPPFFWNFNFSGGPHDPSISFFFLRNRKGKKRKFYSMRIIINKGGYPNSSSLILNAIIIIFFPPSKCNNFPNLRPKLKCHNEKKIKNYHLVLVKDKLAYMYLTV